jgi:uncharacterized membrane protein (DUF485 family)
MDLNFTVLHGRVIQTMEGKIPIVSGNGYTVEGWGRTNIRTDVVREGEVWLKDHQTGRDHHFTLGSEYPPMLVGHDVSMLWVNEQRYAIANHNTEKLVSYPLARAVAPYRSLVSGCATAILVLVVAPVAFLGAMILLAVLFPGFLHTVAPSHRWEVYGLILKVILFGVPLASFMSWLLINLFNRKAQKHNARLNAELQQRLSEAINQYINSYRLPGNLPRYLQ